MEETKTEAATPASNAPTIGQGCAIMAGGALLGLVGCLGAVSIRSDMLVFVFTILGSIVIMWGVAKIVIVIWRAMSRPLR